MKKWEEKMNFSMYELFVFIAILFFYTICEGVPDGWAMVRYFDILLYNIYIYFFLYKQEIWHIELETDHLSLQNVSLIFLILD